MPGPLPIELRQRIVDAYNNGEGTYQELAERFMVGRATVDRVLNRAGGKQKSSVDEAGKQFLTDTLEALPDSTLVELVPDEVLDSTMGTKSGRAAHRLYPEGLAPAHTRALSRLDSPQRLRCELNIGASWCRLLAGGH